MSYVGVDLHKHVITLCVVTVPGGRRKIVGRRRFRTKETAAIRAFFETLGRFQVVVEATAAYEWFFLLIEDLADRLVLAHPKKLRVIAESTRKTDKIDAEVLAVFLALDMIPQAYRPTPRVREYRVLEDVPPHLLGEMGHFFDVYKDLERVEVQGTGWGGLEVAHSEIRRAVTRYERAHPSQA